MNPDSYHPVAFEKGNAVVFKPPLLLQGFDLECKCEGPIQPKRMSLGFGEGQEPRENLPDVGRTGKLHQPLDLRAFRPRTFLS